MTRVPIPEMPAPPRRASAPATATLLTYTVDPSQAFVGLQTTLTITMTNNSGASISLTSGRGGDQILITIPAPPDQTGAAALTDNVSFSGTILTPGYQVGAEGQGSNTFQVYPTSDQVLTPGASIQVSFGPIAVSSIVGTPSLPIEEYIGANSGTSAVTVRKILQQLQVIAWLSPWTVGLNQPSTLYWQSFGGTLVTVTGFPSGGPQKFPVSGNPPSQDSTTVTLLPSDAQRTYTAQVSTNDGRQADDSATLTQQPPQITSLVTIPATPPNPFDPTASAQINWTTMYASTVYLSYPQGAKTVQVPANPSAPFSISPGLDALASAVNPNQIPATAIYLLQAQGYTGPVSSSVSFNLGPIGVLYFKFNLNQSGKLSQPSYMLEGPWPNASQLATSGPALFQLTVNQPGSATTIMYLGSGDTTNSPQIQYFNAASATGGGYMLTWVTANLTSLVLNPGNYAVPQARVASGDYVVNPAATTTYVLTGTGPNGTVNSTLVVVVTGGSVRHRSKSRRKQA